MSFWTFSDLLCIENYSWYFHNSQYYWEIFLKSTEFKKTADFLLISNARQYSANSIAASLKANGTYCATNTIQKWIFYLKEAYVVDEIGKYSKKAKRKLDQARKIYDSDVALNSIRVANGQYDLTHNLENIVYNELLFRGYSLSVYDNNGREVDFLAEKDNKKYYVQVAYSVVENKTYSREFSAFNNLSQIDTKIIITNDEIDYSTSNVRHIKLKDFLMTGLDWSYNSIYSQKGNETIKKVLI